MAEAVMTETMSDLLKARDTLANIEYFKKKYPREELRDIPNILTLHEFFDIPKEIIHATGYGNYRIDGETNGFEFLASDHFRKLVNSEEDFVPNKGEWLICLTACGCGRRNFASDCRNDYTLYGDKCNAEWDAFVEWIESYSPLDMDTVNYKYYFDIQQGLKLFEAFPDKAAEVQKAFDRILNKSKIDQLKAQLAELEGAEE